MTSSPSSPSRPRWYRGLPYLAIFVAFVVIALGYFAPAVFEGRELYQPDVAGASGIAQDVRNYQDATGDTSFWTNSLFGGMPMYQIAPSYPSTGAVKAVQDFLTLQSPFNLLPGYSWLLFAMLGGFFLFLRSLSVRPLPAAIGAVMWTFSSYFIILIAAGHIWKLMVLAFIPPTIAGIILIYRGRYLLGGLLTTLFATIQIMSNHIQMSYYFAFLILFILLAYLVQAVRRKAYRRFVYATLTLGISAVLSLSINASSLYHTYQYSQETIRGGSALTASDPNASTGGVDKEYITQWSYGIGETWTLLVPNLYGGASDYIANSPELMSQVSPEMQQYVGGMSQYFGGQPFTAGPVYVGAFVCFLFFLACFTVRGPFKWALIGGTIFSILLSWGHNMMWLTDLFIDYIPLYNKFRTVSSILVIAEFTIPTLAIWGLVHFLQHPKEVVANRLALGAAAGLSLGVAILFWLMPSVFFPLVSPQEKQMFAEAVSNPMAGQVLTALKSLRISMIASDAMRSIWVILLSLGVGYLYYIGKLGKTLTLLLIGGITLVDLWMVNKRYLRDDMFVESSIVAQRGRPTTEADKLIEQDKDPHYRVLNLSVSPFNDATTSYHHRSVGGYHAAKLSRYQDLIEHQLSKGNQQVLNMLDTRYIITGNEQGQLSVQRNPDALGAAWLAQEVIWAKDATAEMDTLGRANLSTQVVLSDEYRTAVRDVRWGVDSLESVQLTSYLPNKATYQTQTSAPRLLVLSEVFYPHGWHMTIDGKEELPILRADYALRAVVVPAGKHQLEMVFHPHSIDTTERISEIAQLIWLLALLAFGGQYLYRRRKSSPKPKADEAH